VKLLSRIGAARKRRAPLASAASVTDPGAVGAKRPTGHCATLYVVTAMLNPGVTVDAVQSSLNIAHSWYRINITSWVICTNEDATTWSNRLTVFVRPHGSVFICRIDLLDRFGWMTNDFWTWLSAHAQLREDESSVTSRVLSTALMFVPVSARLTSGSDGR